MHCHHEKTIVIDDRIAFVGGIDLTSEAGDRYDRSDHPARSSVGWHDASAVIEDRRSGRRRPLSSALARGDRRAASTTAIAGAGRRCAVAGRANGAREGLPRAGARRLRDPRVIWEGSPLCAEADLPREPVPLVVRDRGGARRQAPATPASGLPPPGRPACEAEQGRRRHTRHARRADRGRRRQWAPAGLLALRTLGESLRPDLRAREDRHRRRQVADDRIGEPERAFALQRHGDEHRHPRRPHRTRHASAPLVRASRTAPCGRSRRMPPPQSTSSGNRSARNNCDAATRACRSLTGLCVCRTSLHARAVRSARSTACSSTADHVGSPILICQGAQPPRCVERGARLEDDQIRAGPEGVRRARHRLDGQAAPVDVRRGRRRVYSIR